MKIEWLGHSCFLITGSNDIRILTDPFDEKIGIPLLKVKVDVVTVSHQHFDHNATHLLPGKPAVIETVVTSVLPDVEIRGIGLFHDDQQGTQRGVNIAFVITVDGFKVCHLGDLGHPLSNQQVTAIGPVDVLCVPVGGFSTIDAQQASEVISLIKPAVVLPMHYKVKNSNVPISAVNDFLRIYPRAERMSALVLDKQQKTDGRLRVVVLDIKRN